MATPPVTTTYTLTTTINGCVETEQVTVTVDVGLNPTADAGDNVNICAGESTTLGGTPTAPAGTTVVWSPSTGLDNPMLMNPTASPSTTTTYTVMVIDGECTNIDEVTVAVENCGVFDLALSNLLSPGQGEFSSGDDVSFTIYITNQGDHVASDIQIVDYIPEGLTLNDADWMLSGDKALITLAGSLASGASTSIDITFTIDDGFTGTIVNFAEIMTAIDDFTGLEGIDVDSTPDMIDDNDSGGIINTADDNFINGDSTIGEDEDDHDPEDITVVESGVYDLALIKTLSDAQDQSSILVAGDEVTFNITVCNQGEVPSGAFTVVDQIPTGITFVNAEAGGTHNDVTNAIFWEFTQADEILAGDCQSFDYTLEILEEPSKGFYRNFAEITTDSGDDEDSTPDTNIGFDDGDTITGPNDDTYNHNDPTFDNSPNDEDDHDYEDIFVFDSIVKFEMRAALQGATINNTSSNEMRSDITGCDLFPMVEPYDDMGNFQHMGAGGGETCDPSLLYLTGGDELVDWMFIELRDADDPTQVVATCSVLLQADGDIITPDGSGTIQFVGVASGEYYIALRHRNHLGVMTANPVDLNSVLEPMIDFTDPATQTWGTDALADINGLMALWAGNADAQGGVVFQGANNDMNTLFFQVLADPDNAGLQTNFICVDYAQGDLDMNCQAIFQGNLNDSNIIFFNVLIHPNNGGNDVNYILVEQLP